MVIPSVLALGQAHLESVLLGDPGRWRGTFLVRSIAEPVLSLQEREHGAGGVRVQLGLPGLEQQKAGVPE